MKQTFIKALAICLLLFISQAAHAKSAFFLKFIGLTYHFQGGKGYEGLYPAKLDEKGYFVMNFGGVAGYDYYFKDSPWSGKIEAGLYRDCAGLPAGMVHIGLRFRVLEAENHLLYAGIGPTILIRKSWKQFAEYMPDIYTGGGNIEYIVAPGIEIEYDYMIDSNNAFSFSTIPYFPISLNFFAGWKYYLD